MMPECDDASRQHLLSSWSDGGDDDERRGHSNGSNNVFNGVIESERKEKTWMKSMDILEECGDACRRLSDETRAQY